MGGQTLELSAINNLSMPYDGFLELTLTLAGNRNDFSICVPFLVTPMTLDQTIIGFNVVHELIPANSSEDVKDLFFDAMFSSFNSTGKSELKTFINLVQDFGQN